MAHSNARLEVIIDEEPAIHVYTAGDRHDEPEREMYSEIARKWGSACYIKYDGDACSVLNWLHSHYGVIYLVFMKSTVYKPSDTTGKPEKTSIVGLLEYLSRCFEGEVALVYDEEELVVFKSAQDALDFIKDLSYLVTRWGQQ